MKNGYRGEVPVDPADIEVPAPSDGVGCGARHCRTSGRRLAVMPVNLTVLSHILRCDRMWQNCTTDAPKDLEVIRIFEESHDIPRGVVRLLMRSESFAEVPENAFPPTVEFTYKDSDPCEPAKTS